MKTLLSTLILCILCIRLAAQTEKGATPLAQSSSVNPTSSVTRAVVVGISDYQDKDIPDLRFADRDAEAFANFLRSPAGGSLDGDHLKLLTNEKATAGRIAEALDGLIEQAKEGDQVIIYFSGHGDVERKTVSQPGFLLAWDAPSRVYMGGGTYSLAFLQEIVSTLSTQNLAKVTVITDACHAGKLAGSQIGGAQLTSANLAKQYANEVKILSCQPNEFSLEGEQWGGGRGVFSYHLVDGLFGLADRNGDGTVTVGEIDRYLEDHVTAEAAPQSQVPMLLGNKTERLATVSAAILAELKKAKATGMPIFTATESRGFEDEVLAKVDTSVREMYRAFKLAVQEKRFFTPAGNSAEDYFAQLTGVEALAPLRGIMKRNYAATLQDDAQQVMNKWLKTDLGELSLSKKTATDKYQPYPRYLKRAAELLGAKHYMYPFLKARVFFFEGYLLALSNRNPNKELGEKALAKFHQALQWQPDLPQIYLTISQVYAYNLLQPDSAEHYAQRAIELQQSWVQPYVHMVNLHAGWYKQFDRAKSYLEQATLIDSNLAVVWRFWGDYYRHRQEYAIAEQHYIKAIQLDTTYTHAYLLLGVVYSRTGQLVQEEQQYKKATQLDSTFAGTYHSLGSIYFKTNRFIEAEQTYKKAIQLDSTYIHPYSLLGKVYFKTKRPDEARQNFLKAIALNPDYWQAMLGMAYLLHSEGKTEEAIGYVEQAIGKGSTFEQLEKDEDLAQLRVLPEWKTLMKKYFPDQVKD